MGGRSPCHHYTIRSTALDDDAISRVVDQHSAYIPRRDIPHRDIPRRDRLEMWTTFGLLVVAAKRTQDA
jgi:hypothetical protein